MQTLMNIKAEIYYLIPDLYRKDYSLKTLVRSFKNGKLFFHLAKEFKKIHKPVGGVKVILQHCLILKELGYDVKLIKLGDYEGNFFNFDVDIYKYSDVAFSMSPESIVVIPECCPGYQDYFNKYKKVLFAQNTRIYGGVTHSYFDIDKSFVDNGFVKIMTCSDFVANALSKEPLESVSIINNFIDQKKFIYKSEYRVENRVLALPRKNAKDIEKIISLANGLGYDFVFADALTESELIDEYHKADIFLASGYPEGFGLPPLEAMACGAVVVGFTGGGANEFMIHKKTALVAKDGDVDKVAGYLAELKKDIELKENIRKGGLNISQKYTRKRTEKQLDNFFKILSNQEL